MDRLFYTLLVNNELYVKNEFHVKNKLHILIRKEEEGKGMKWANQIAGFKTTLFSSTTIVAG